MYCIRRVYVYVAFRLATISEKYVLWHEMVFVMSETLTSDEINFPLMLFSYFVLQPFYVNVRY